MDAIERKSWVLSLTIHVVMVLMSIFSFSLPVLALRSTEASLPPVPATSQPKGEVLLAPDSATGSAAGAFPPLPSLRGHPAPSADVITPASTSFAGKERSRGDRPGRSAAVELPRASTPVTPLSDALRGQRANPTLSKDAANRRAAADHVDYVVKQQYLRIRRGYASQITNRSLVIEVIVDERGVIRRAELFHCTTGVPDLDLAIKKGLVEQLTNLPPVRAGETLRFAVVLP